MCVCADMYVYAHMSFIYMWYVHIYLFVYISLDRIPQAGGGVATAPSGKQFVFCFLYALHETHTTKAEGRA